MRSIFYLIFITILSPLSSLAQGNLLITPMRVVFEGPKKIQELNLANTGRDTARYLISLIEIRMNSNGTFEKISEPDSGQQFASRFLRIFPKSVTLGPGEAQLVKVQLTKTSQLQPGECRSHIYFRAVPDTKALGEQVMLKDTSGRIARRQGNAPAADVPEPQQAERQRQGRHYYRQKQSAL
jgi:P pilus assembly chaperone PapD